MVAAGVVNFEDALSMTGHGKFHLYILLSMGMTLMAVIMETQGVMFIVPAAKCDLNLNVPEKGLLSSINYIGVFASSHLMGFLSDTTGRKKVIMMSLIFTTIFSVISSFIPLGWLFIVCRFFTGFFIGGASSTLYAYAGEFHAAKHRPRAVAWITTFVSLATLVLPGFAWPMLSETWTVSLSFVEFRPWRLMVIAYSIPTVISAVCLWLLPESPKYLLSQGKHDESLRVLKTMFKVNTGKDGDEFPAKELVLAEGNLGVEEAGGWCSNVWNQTVPLFKSPFLKQTLMVCSLHLGVFLVCGVQMWYPEILNELSVYVNDHHGTQPTLCMAIDYHQKIVRNVSDTVQEVCSDAIDTSVFVISMYISVAMVVCFILCGFFINALGKGNLLKIFLALGIVSAIVGQLVAGTVIVPVALCGMILTGTCVSITNAVIVDLYPTRIKGMALAISLMCGRVGAALGANLTGAVMYGLCDYFLFLFVALFVGLILIAMFLPSKAPGKSVSLIVKPV